MTTRTDCRRLPPADTFESAPLVGNPRRIRGLDRSMLERPRPGLEPGRQPPPAAQAGPAASSPPDPPSDQPTEDGAADPHGSAAPFFVSAGHSCLVMHSGVGSTRRHDVRRGCEMSGMNSSEILIDGFGRVAGNVHRTLDGICARRADRAARPGREHDRLAGLAPDPGRRTTIWPMPSTAIRCGRRRAGRSGSACRSTPAPPATRRAATRWRRFECRRRAAARLPRRGAAPGPSSTWRRSTDADLDRVVDTNWDPPVTLGVRLVSVMSDGLQHAGQAAYVRGLPSAGVRLTPGSRRLPALG